MKQNIPFLKIIDQILLLALLSTIVVQLYFIFTSHKDYFENPKQLVNESYENDFISQYGLRFPEVKKMFSKPTRMAYIGEANEDLSSGWTNYFLTQYYLAPNLVLKNSNTLDTIIYNLYNTKQINIENNYYLHNGWHIVKDFNNGLIILSK